MLRPIPYQSVVKIIQIGSIMTVTLINYPEIAKIIAALTENETDEVAIMATVACEFHHADDRFNWTGFYRNVGQRTLKVGPYQGGHGCLKIPFGKGVCGVCADTGTIQRVDDVDTFDGHIACATSTRSELVLPVYGANGRLLGVFDIDSDLPAAFTKKDAIEIATILNNAFATV
jgi:GAF domain-containing protein